MYRKVLLALVLVGILAVPVYAEAPTYNGYPTVNVLVNGQALTSEVPPIIMDGRTLLPLRAVATALGATVTWNADIQTVVVTAPDPVALQAQVQSLQTQLAAANRQVVDLQSTVTQLKAQLASGTITQPTPPAPTTGPKLSVLSYTIRKGSYSTHVHALLKNTGDGATAGGSVSLSATSNGTLTGTASGDLPYGLIVQPEQKIPVDLRVTGDIPADAQLSWSYSTKATDQAPPKLTLTGTNVTRDSFNTWHAIGTLRNDDTRTVRYVKAIVAFYDQQGKFLYSSYSYASQSDLSPGSSTTFDVRADSDVVGVAKTEITLAGNT